MNLIKGVCEMHLTNLVVLPMHTRMWWRNYKNNEAPFFSDIPQIQFENVLLSRDDEHSAPLTEKVDS